MEMLSGVMVIWLSLQWLSKSSLKVIYYCGDNNFVLIRYYLDFMYLSYSSFFILGYFQPFLLVLSC